MYLNDWQPSPTVLPLLNLNEVHLWRTFVDHPNDDSAAWVLSPDEQLRASRFVFPIHRQRFIHARASLKFILARYLNESPEKIVFHYTSQGKPYLSQPLYFNTSHSNQYALYAIGTTGEIGIDIEHIRSDIEIDAIAERFFSPYENQQLKVLPTSEKLSAFFQIWTYKEAFLKAIGDGLSFPLKDFDVDIQKNCLIEVREKKEMATDWSLLPLSVAEGYSAALAVKTKLSKIQCWEFK